MSVVERAKKALGVSTSKEMATKLGLAESSISSWKSKDIIPAEHLKHIASISNVSLDWLMLGRDSEHSTQTENSIKSNFSASDAVGRAKQALGVSTDLAMAQALGLHPTVIGGYKKRNSVPLEQSIKIAEMTGVDLNWLIMGKGVSPNGQSTISQDDFVKIPCFDIEASAGNGSTFDLENIIDEVMFSRVWMHAQGLFQKDLVCIQVKGDSMAGLLEDGDTVLVNTARKHGDGVFVIRIGEQVRIKRLQWLSDGHVKLISENPAYENELIDPKQLGDAFQVLGAAHTKIGRLS